MPATAIRAAIVGLASALLVAAAPVVALAETLSFKAELVPVDGTDSKAAGNLTADYDTASKKFTWSGTYRGLGTYATAGGFHGPPGAHSGFVRLRNIDSPFEGTAILSDKQGQDLTAGLWSIVIRTAAFPNGELRGQVVRAN
jgi:hypothetical protein